MCVSEAKEELCSRKMRDGSYSYLTWTNQVVVDDNEWWMSRILCGVFLCSKSRTLSEGCLRRGTCTQKESSKNKHQNFETKRFPVISDFYVQFSLNLTLHPFTPTAPFLFFQPLHQNHIPSCRASPFLCPKP